MSTGEVEDFLLQSGQPLTIAVDEEEGQVITPANAFMQLASEVKHLQKEITLTKEQLSAAHEEIIELKEQQKQSMDVLTHEIKSVSDGISRLGREKQKREEKSFWARLFGR